MSPERDELLRDLIRTHYTLADIRRLRESLAAQGTFDFPAFENGLFPAAAMGNDDGGSGYSSVWVRDNACVAFAHHAVGRSEVARRTVRSLLAFFQKHSWRFAETISGTLDHRQPMNRPHIRFEGRTLSEIDQQWPHAQNDALGYFLWLLAELWREDRGSLALGADDLELIAALVLYFQAIRFWEDEDSGHWEETRKRSASSIGVVTAALQRLRDCLVQHPSRAPACRMAGRPITIEKLDDLIQEGSAALSEILPSECRQSDPEKERRYDAALLFLIYPLRLLDETMSRQIVEDVVAHLQGDYGIRRYRGDSYWAPNYKKKLAPAERTVDFSDNLGARNKLLENEGDEAQWCLFDPILACIYGEWFAKSGLPQHLERQTEYLNRSLNQLTRSEAASSLRSPELYYREEGRYVPNDHTPLLWAEANLLVALNSMEQSLSRHEGRGKPFQTPPPLLWEGNIAR